MFYGESTIKEFEEIANELNAIMLEQCVHNALSSNWDAEDVSTQARTLKLLERALDLFGVMLERRWKLMAKLDKALDKYLEE